MRTMGKPTLNQLSARRVSGLTTPGVYTDGLGLILRVDDRGNRKWILRVSNDGRRRDIGLGSAREVTLAEARERRDEIRKAMRAGVDPIAAKRRREAVPEFAVLAREIHAGLKADWRNGKHQAQWLRTLEIYAFPALGNLKVDVIDGPAVEGVLKPLWGEKAETARRVRQRVRRVLDVAIAQGHRPGPNPADAAMAGFSAKRPRAKHHAAMPWPQLPTFYARLAASGMSPSARLAFMLLILTAARTGEVLGAQWDEIDEKAALWTVPAERMKMAKLHRVPLAAPTLAILGETRKWGDGTLVFPGPKRGKPLSNMVFAAALKRLAVPYTAHGFRSSFRDWAEETTAFPHAVKEAALAHRVKDAVERAYQRSDLLEQRRALMKQWADFVTGRA